MSFRSGSDVTPKYHLLQKHGYHGTMYPASKHDTIMCNL